MNLRTWTTHILLGLAALRGAGCATAAPDVGPHPAWPGPPASPRIVHRLDLRQSSDLMRPSFLDALGNLVFGEQPLRLIRPNCAALNADNLLAVTDQELQAVVLFNLRNGRTLLADKAGPTGNDHFVSPVGVAACPEGFIVADSALNKVVLLNTQGEYQRDIIPPKTLARPTGLAYDASRRELYVVDTLAHEILVYDLQGQRRRRFGGPGREPGQFNFPTHICVDPAGKVYVTDSMNYRVQVFTPEGRYLLEFGKQGDATGYLAVPKGVGVDRAGHIYVVDSYTTNVQVFDATGQFLLSFGSPGSARGEFLVPSGLCLSPDNRIFVCDGMNHRLQVFQYVGEPANATHPSTP